MQGTGYAIGEVILFLVVSAVIGFGIGWLLGRWLQRTSVAVDIEDQLAAEQERTRQMEARLDERSRDLDAVRTEFSRAKRLLAAASLDMSLGEQLVTAQERVVQLEGEQRARVAEIARLTKTAGELDEARERIASLEAQLAERGAAAETDQARIAELETSAAEAQVEAETHQARIAEFETQLAERGAAAETDQARIAELETSAAEAQVAVETHQGRIAEFEAQLAERGAAAETDQARIAEFTASLAEAQVAVETHTARIAEFEAQLAERGAAVETHQARIASLEAQLSERGAAAETHQARIAELAASLSEALAEVEAVPAEVGEDSGAGKEPADEAAPTGKEEAIAKITEIAARTAGDAPLADDDLKKVRGIGPKTEQLLKEMGITSYRQIAGLHDDEIVYLAAALDAFPGRIHKDDWMGRAAAAHRRKYGQPL